MLYTLKNRLGDARALIMNKGIAAAGLETELCARYGYGLTVRSGDDTYLLHLPDVAHDALQAATLKNAALPDDAVLMRLKRRVWPERAVIDISAGFGARPMFYARSLKAPAVCAVSLNAHDAALVRKHVVLNDLDGVVSLHELRADGTAAPVAALLDGIRQTRHIEAVALLSMDRAAVQALALDGARTLVHGDGPAVIVWGQGMSAEERAAVTCLMAEQGYPEPEMWTADTLFWASRI